MKSAIITGANGFIGKAVVKTLLAEEVEVYALVRDKQRASGELYETHIIECDMDRYYDLPRIMKGINPDVMYHFAWNGTAGKRRGDERVQLHNVQGTCNAVRAAKAIGCKRFVFPSSIMQYEVDSEIKGMKNPAISAVYSTAKLTADYMARIIAADSHLEYISAMISNVYGPGECSPRFINSSIRKLLNGEHLSLTLGQQLYDFIYITDAARMFAVIGAQGIAGRNYYIGNTEPRPLRSFVEEMRDTVAPEAYLGFGEIPYSGRGLTYTEFDTSLLCKDTGVIPKVSFSEGILHTRDWIIKQESRV